VPLCADLRPSSVRVVKRVKAYLPGTHAPPEFHRHRYPGISLEELQRRIDRFKLVIGDNTPVIAKPLYDQIYLLYSGKEN
jgi:hypothetical protein